MPPRAAVAVSTTEPPNLVVGMGTAEPMKEAEPHGELEINFVYEGALRYFMGGRFVEVPAGSFSVFWGAMPHQLVEVEPNTEFMFVHLPLVRLLRWNLSSPFMRKLLAGELVADPQSSGWDGELTRRWVVDARAGDPNALHICELEVEARLRRLASKRQYKAAHRTADNKARKQVEAITAFLAESYRNDISTADIGRAISLHPNYAMTLFRRECGMSIWQYLIRLRLSHAQLMLLSTEKTVLAIALESGFGSLARFYAAFTRECGMSPGEFRKRSTP